MPHQSPRGLPGLPASAGCTVARRRRLRAKGATPSAPPWPRTRKVRAPCVRSTALAPASAWRRLTAVPRAPLINLPAAFLRACVRHQRAMYAVAAGRLLGPSIICSSAPRCGDEFSLCEESQGVQLALPQQLPTYPHNCTCKGDSYRTVSAKGGEHGSSRVLVYSNRFWGGGWGGQLSLDN